MPSHALSRCGLGVVGSREMTDITFEPFAEHNRADPHPQYHALRSQSPVWLNEAFGEWVLTSYEACERVLRDPKFSSNPEHLSRDMPDLPGDLRTGMRDTGVTILLFMDPPDHTRLRRLVGSAFTPRRVEALRPRVQQIVDDL